MNKELKTLIFESILKPRKEKASAAGLFFQTKSEFTI